MANIAIISDGTTDIELTRYTENDADADYDIGITKTSGGRARSQVGGERVNFNEIFMMSQSELKSVMNLLTNGASAYFYDPGFGALEYDGKVGFPMEAVFKYKGKTERLLANGAREYFVKFEIMGADNLRS